MGLSKVRWLNKVFALTLSALAAACATNPATGQREFSLMSEDKEIQIGQEQDAQVRREMGVYEDNELQQYVNDVGLKLARTSDRPNLPWHFTIVDVPAINAFALPGGYIYITRGILPYLQDEAQMAGVLGHEIGHVNARHSARQYSRSTASQLGLIVGSILAPQTRPFAQLGESGLGLLMLKNSRDDELEADSLGARYAARAGQVGGDAAGGLARGDAGIGAYRWRWELSGQLTGTETVNRCSYHIVGSSHEALNSFLNRCARARVLDSAH